MTYQNLNSFNLNDIESYSIYKKFINSIQNQLKKDHNNINIEDIGILLFLKENWMDIDNTEKFNKIFYEMLHPFVQLIFNNNIPKRFQIILRKFESVAFQYHQRVLSLKTINYLKINNLEDLLSDSETLPNALVRRYLKSGINHVLVGMNNISYVDELKNKFNNKAY